MNKLIILLKQLNIIDECHELLHAQLKKVIVHKNNLYEFYIHSHSFIPFDEYKLLEDHKDDFPYPISFHLEYDELDYEHIDFSMYIGLIIEKLKKESLYFSTLTSDDVSISDKIKIQALNEIQLEQFMQQKSFIVQLFNQYGFSLDVDFVIDENNDDYLHLIDEMENIQPVEIDLEQIKKDEDKKTTFDSQFSRFQNRFKKDDAHFYQLHEITNQTIDNNAVIEGYIFKTELIKTRKGSHIQTLWITDYTDSIMVKRFENKTNNSIEDIKVLDKGTVCIKATG